MTTLSTFINKLSIKVLCKNENRMTINPWYDNECNIARKSIKDSSNESLKFEKKNRYTVLIKGNKGAI